MSKDQSQGVYEGIAIVGMSGRFPGAPDVSTFWENVKLGRETVTHFPKEELELNIPAEDLQENGNYVCSKGQLDDIDMFDARFFGYLPKEAEVMDPQHRVFLEICSEAIEHAGYDTERYPGAIGVYGGCYMDTYLLSNLCSDEDFREKLVESIQVGTLQTELGNDKDYLATRVAFKLGLRGPAMTLQTACSTSLVSIATACQSLDGYHCDMALAGGVTIVLPQKKGYYYKEGSMLSPDGRCRPFDKDAAGTVFSNGAAVLLLKRLEDAVNDRDTIYGVIKGYAMNNDGGQKVSYTAPSVDGQAEVISLAMAMGEIDPRTMGYVEAHGTATPLGDPIEIAGLTKAYRLNTDDKQFCALGSVKANLGHLDCASGAIGLIKSTLSVYNKTLVPCVHFNEPNPKIDFEKSPFYVNTDLKNWEEAAWPRRAGISSFGVGGTNAHVVIEEAPLLPYHEIQHEAWLLPLSAKSEKALMQYGKNLGSHLQDEKSTKLNDVSFTLQEGRTEHDHRGFVVGKTQEKLIESLSSENGFNGRGKKTTSEPEIIFMFPGQGAQYPGMGRELYYAETVFRNTIDEISSILLELDHFNIDIKDYILWSEETSTVSYEDTARALAQTCITQPCVFALEMAAAKLLEHWGIVPKKVIGHSVGEFAAVCHAGILSLQDASKLIAERGRLIHDLPTGSMVAILMAESDVREILPKGLSIAAINAPSSTVVSGETKLIEQFARELEEKGTKTTLLATSHAFHSDMMAPAEDRLQECAKAMNFSASARFDCVSTATGQNVTAQDFAEPEYWSQQMRAPVQFMTALQQAASDASDAIFLEVGPGQALSAFARQSLKSDLKRPVYPLLGPSRDPGSDYVHALTMLGNLWTQGVRPNWSNLQKGDVRRTALPTYPFERKRFWVEPQKRNPRNVVESTISDTPLKIVASEPSVINATEAIDDELETLIRQQLNVISGQLKILNEQ